MPPPYSLIIHGGAGLLKGLSPEQEARYHTRLQKILEEGKNMLEHGSSALDVVEQCVIKFEDDPLFNAGCGSVLNEDGEVEMDAALMNGADLKAGSVAAVRFVKNPIHLARLVMDRTEHVMLIGKGAETFGRLQQIEERSMEYFITEFRASQLSDAKKQERVVLDHDDLEQTATQEKKYGTVGACARDTQGHLAAATSTGGITNKKFGRVGDSPIIGAGVYADDDTCAVSATGYGEQFIRSCLSKTISDIMLFQGCSTHEAADRGIAYLVKKVKGVGGVIVIGHDGVCVSAFSSERMIRGWIDDRGEVITKLD